MKTGRWLSSWQKPAERWAGENWCQYSSSCLSKGCICSKRSSPEQPGQDYFERNRKRLVTLMLIQGVNSDLNRQLAPVRERQGLDRRLLKEPETDLERLPLLKNNLQRDTELYLRCLIEIRRRTSRRPSSERNTLKITFLRKTSKTFKWDTEEYRWGKTWRTSTCLQNLLSARWSVDLFLWQPRILQLALHSHQWNQT